MLFSPIALTTRVRLGSRINGSLSSWSLVHCHTVPMEEIVRAFNFVIDQGWVRSWFCWLAPLRVRPYIREV